MSPHHEDYAPPPPSPRKAEADSLGAQLLAYGVEVTEPARHPSGRCWRMQCRAGPKVPGPPVHFGIEVYSPEYFRVYFQDGEFEGLVVFASAAETLAYCWARWVHWDDAMAARIPTWRPKRKPKERPIPKTVEAVKNYLEGVEFPPDLFGGGNG